MRRTLGEPASKLTSNAADIDSATSRAMISVKLGVEHLPVRRILCLGAHSDDIEIGCGGTMLRLVEAYPDAEIWWVVLSGSEQRAAEARCGASLILANAKRTNIVTKTFRDGFFPYVGDEIKEYFELLKVQPAWDVIFTHYRQDLHQDHRIVSELTWNTFRDHLIFEYEIPKYDGGLGSPNVFVPLDGDVRARKIGALMQAFGTQRDKRWFSPETFEGLMRIRGIECACPSGYAEAFYSRKLVLG